MGCPSSIGGPLQIVGLTIEKEQVCIVVAAIIYLELVVDIITMATFPDLGKISFCHILNVQECPRIYSEHSQDEALVKRIKTNTSRQSLDQNIIYIY